MTGNVQQAPKVPPTPAEQAAIERFRRIEARDEQTAYAWLAGHFAGSPQGDAYVGLQKTVGQEVINGYFNKYGQAGKGAAFGPGGTRRQGFFWAYHPSNSGGDFATWETTFPHNSTALPPPDISAVVVDLS